MAKERRGAVRHAAAQQALLVTTSTAWGSVELGFEYLQCFPEAIDITSQLRNIRLELVESLDAVSRMGSGWRRRVVRQRRFWHFSQKMRCAEFLSAGISTGFHG